MKLVEDDAEIAIFPLWDPAIDSVSVLKSLNDIWVWITGPLFVNDT